MFVGRSSELRTLARAVETVGSSTGVLISGAAGSGKSRLLAEARHLAPDVPSFAVVGFEAERRVPLSAAAGLLRGLAAIPGHGQALDALVFGAGGGHPTSGVPSAAGTFEPLRIFEAGRRALQTVERALLVIDDLHWFDELSLSFCHYLVRAAVEADQQITVLAATRPGGPGEELFDAFPADRRYWIELGPLDEPDAVQLVQALDPALDAQAATGIWLQSGGVPFWIEALVLYPRSGDRLDRVLTHRLRGTGRDAAALLGTLAVAGRPISVAMAADVLEFTLDRAESALRVLIERGLAELHQGGAQPAHNLVRSAAVAQLPAQVRAHLHGRLAVQFERAAAGDLQLLRLALEHRRAAGMPAVALARTLARAPQRRLLGATGVAELAVLADEADPVAPETIALQADVAALSYELGDHEQALARWSLVAGRAADVATRAEAALRASRAAYGLGRAAEARDLLALSREPASDDAVLRLEQMTHDAAICLWLEQRGTEGRALAREAASVATALARDQPPLGRGDSPPRRAMVDALRLQYEAAMQEGDPVALLRAARQREAAARDGGLEDMLEADLAVGVALRQTGRVWQAVGRFRRVWAGAQRAVLPRLTVDAGFWLGRSLALMGNLGEADGILEETAQLTRRVGDVPRARHLVARVVAGVWLERGNVAKGLELLDRHTAPEVNEHQRIVFHADRAVWAARLHGAVATRALRAHLDAAETCVISAGCPRCAGEQLLVAAEALARIGDHDAALAALERRDRLGFPLDDVDKLTRLHVGALAAVEATDRAAGLEAAVAAASLSPYRLAAAWIRFDLGCALAATGDERAIVELKRASIEARSCGAETVIDLADQRLRALGVRTWRRGAAGAPLTAREEEVARLVAGGATNREVAATLFVSPKTVERHLVNLFRKLEVRNRTELAARLAEIPS